MATKKKPDTTDQTMSPDVLQPAEEDLKTQLLRILATDGILPEENTKPILGTELLEKIKPKLIGEFSDVSIRNYFSQFSKNENSPIARTAQGYGYFRRRILLENNAALIGSEDEFTESGDETGTASRDNQAEEKFRAIYMQYLERERKFPAHIEHTKAQRAIKGLNTWKFPDVVTLAWNIGIPSETEDQLLLDRNLLEIKKSIGDPPFNLISTELKVNISVGNFRQYFFQCVSNSKWAHEAHLVIACKIKDAKLLESLQKLGASFGVSIFSFNFDEKNLSKIPSADDIRKMTGETKENLINLYCSDINIIYYSQPKDNLDWDHIQDVREINSDFNNIFKWLSKCLKDQQAYSLSLFKKKEKEDIKSLNFFG